MKKIVIFLCCLLAGCVSSHDSNLSEANIKLGLAYLMQEHDAALAKEKLLLAQQQSPRNPMVWDASGYFYEMTGNFTAAEKAYLHAIRLASSNKGASQNNYGAFLCRQKKYKLAIDYFLLAISDPQYLSVANAYENAANCALKIPDVNLATTYFHMAELNRVKI